MEQPPGRVSRRDILPGDAAGPLTSRLREAGPNLTWKQHFGPKLLYSLLERGAVRRIAEVGVDPKDLRAFYVYGELSNGGNFLVKWGHSTEEIARQQMESWGLGQSGNFLPSAQRIAWLEERGDRRDVWDLFSLGEYILEVPGFLGFQCWPSSASVPLKELGGIIYMKYGSSEVRFGGWSNYLRQYKIKY